MTAARNAFACPKCGGDTRVTCVIRGEKEIRRYRKCTECDHKFGTSQTHEIVSEKGFFDKLGRKARLTPEQVREIRSKAAKGRSHFDLAIDYDVNPKQIWRIVTGRSWRPVV